eukprot:2984483-Karenia_brevis.AAC.1
MAILSQLSTCFDSTSSSYYVVWDLALKILGPMDGWESAWVQEANTCVNIIIGNLWRRFYFVFSSWPWRLHIIVDDQRDMASRRAVAQDFLNTPMCCLDEFFSHRLRSQVKEVDDLFLKPIQRFLTAVFVKGVACTTHMENVFAAVRHMLTNKGNRPPHFGTVSSAMVIKETRRVHKNWLQQIEVPDRASISARRRPVWTYSKKKRHKGMCSARTEWMKFQLPKLYAEKPYPFDKDKATHRSELVAEAWAEWRHVRANPAAFKMWQSQARVAKNNEACQIDPLQ